MRHIEAYFRHTRVRASGQRAFREHHVRFFGRVAQRAWVTDNWIIPYAGKQEFEARREAAKEACSKKKGSAKKKPLKAFVASGIRNKVQWEEAIEGEEKCVS